MQGCLASQAVAIMGVSLLFGTVTNAHNADSICALRQHLDKTPNLEWVRDTVSGLPVYWDLLVKKLPHIGNSVPAQQILDDFDRWLRQGFKPEEDNVALGNTILLPLVVMVGLTEFWQHVVDSTETDCDDPLHAFLTQLRAAEETSCVESIGLCAGMLTAFAVASSHTRSDFEKYGAVSIRLAMMIGMATDAQEVRHGQAISYVASWRTPEQGEQLKRSVDLVYPQAYMSVLYDERRVTITTTAQWIRTTILRQLRGAGLTVAESNIQGHIHCPDSESKDISDAICELCRATPALQLADVSKLALWTYTNDGHGDPVRDNSLHELAVRSTLAKQCCWYETIAALPFSHVDSTQKIVSFGPERCVPPSLVPSLGGRWTHLSTIATNTTPTSATPTTPTRSQPPQRSKNISAAQPPSSGSEKSPPRELSERRPRQGEPTHSPEHTIAVVGMSLRTAGADDVEEFSRMIQSGTSQHELVGPERVKFHTLWREGDWDPSYKWYANWMRDVDTFDHQFFKRSPREAANMDPAQRLALQTAYQAVESAGYYTYDNNPEMERKQDPRGPNHVGVYLGVTLDDYQNHVRSHRANAFSITGTMRSLHAGKVAHHFGWTGPALTVDTACSSSAVAIHTACRDLLAGDCDAALAGGVNVITDPLAFQDLAAAGFLSPTGQCKSFDERADGYCRGEAVGFVFLKRLSDAVADGNQILGCIASSTIYQNDNSTPIFVPNSPSLLGLFKNVMRKAQVQPSDISVVEAHGTGTPVGDPAEWESVRQALETPKRADPVYIGSAKGHVGHTEAASGVVALVKVLTMVQGGHIPPQASHSRLNHLIQPSDMMQVATSQRPWQPERKVVLLNNYGASGSNVAMIVTEPPSRRPRAAPAPALEEVALPFCVAGRTVKSLKANCTRILSYIDQNSEVKLTDLSFNMHRKFGRHLRYRVAFKCSSPDDLRLKLSQVATGFPEPEAGMEIKDVQPDRSVILCFGGQVSTAIGLDRELYDRTRILRHYLDECDAATRSFGLRSIYPGIFSQQPVQDQQHLQTMLFAMQYSCAMCWMKSGLSSRVVALVGHSFGELTAMCISGVLSLHDAVKLVAGRARLIRDHWGPDPGVMLAVEAEEETVHTLLSEASQAYTGPSRATIACYNGPRSFTLAGSQEAIGVVRDLISKRFPAMRNKTLRVTNAFHSGLVEPLEEQLKLLGHGLSFQKPCIPLERTTETRSALELLGPQYVADQMRQPVFFRNAVQRLSQDYPNSVWLEAGCSSTVTAMAQRALDAVPRKSNHFQAIKINEPNAFENLSEATVSLWKEGLPASFWPHNASQTSDYATLVMPPYQFEKEKHWVELGDPVELIEQIKQAVRSEISVPHANPAVAGDGRFVFTGYRDSHGDSKRQPCFQINTSSKEYHDLVQDHVVANTAGICSGMLQATLVTDALFSLHPEWATNGIRTSLHDMANHAPICLNPSRVLSLEFEKRGEGSWDWKIVGLSAGASRILHTTGRLQLRDPRDIAYQTEFRRLGRLVDHARCSALLNTGPRHGDVEILQGRSIYRTFHDVVAFGEQYRGLRWLVGRGNESAGHVSRAQHNEALFDLLRGEHISQVGGIWVNCMTGHNPDDIFLGAEIEMSMVSPDWGNRPLPGQLDVLARHQHHKETGDYTTDTFVFDSTNGDLVQVVLGVRYTRTSRASFARVLQRMTSAKPAGNKIELSSPPIPKPVTSPQPTIQAPKIAASKQQEPEASSRDLLKEMGEVVANLVGVDVADIGPDANLADFGIDSLLGLELQGEIKTVFDCTPDEVALMRATTLRELVRCLPIAEDSPGPGTSDDGIQCQPSDDSSPDDSDSSSQSSEPSSSSTGPLDLLWSTSDILESFSETKKLGDQMIREFGLETYDSVVVPESNRLCMALLADAFEQLGCPLRSARPGQSLDPIPFQPQHKIFVRYIYDFLEKTVGLMTAEDNGKRKRTGTPIPTASSQSILNELVDKYPAHEDFLRLTFHAGSHLAQGLKGETDGNRVMMSNPEGRRLCQAVYHNYVLNRIGFETMRDVLKRLTGRMRADEKGPLRVLELGGGTGSATSQLLPLLASLDVPVEYTFTDLSSSLVAQARRTLGKQYPFMRFAVQDIEKPVGKELAGQQHLVVASHCVHATRSLTESTRNIRQALRPDGFLMMLEMREAWPSLDLSFGLYEGWWLFEDGRTHAYTSHEAWKRSLTAAGYGAVDWTDGTLPEHKYYMVVIALASAIRD